MDPFCIRVLGESHHDVLVTRNLKGKDRCDLIRCFLICIVHLFQNHRRS